LTADTPILTAPSFDHALKDPTPDAVSVFPHHRIVVIEGLYTHLSIDPWREAAELLDERWFLDVAVEDAERRLVKRHVTSGIVKDWDDGVRRAQENDMPSEWSNVHCPLALFKPCADGRFVLENNLHPTKVIQSINDPLLALP